MLMANAGPIAAAQDYYEAFEHFVTSGMCSETGGARAMPTAALKEKPCELHFDCPELSRTRNLSKLRRRLSLQRVFGWQGLGMQEASGEP